MLGSKSNDISCKHWTDQLDSVYDFEEKHERNGTRGVATMLRRSAAKRSLTSISMITGDLVG
jgi:hypothetical protein